MKKLMTMLKYWNNLLNNRISAVEEGRQMTNLLFLKNSLLETIEAKKQLDIQYRQRLANIKAQHVKEIEAIDAVFPPEQTVKRFHLDKPVNDFEVTLNEVTL